MIQKLDLLQPKNATARTIEEAVTLSHGIGYPLVVRPSYVLGGRAMEIVYSESELRHYMKTAVQVSDESPVLLDFFLPNAIEVDVDAICDGEQVVIGGIMQHIEQAGIHSGDSACSLPPYSLSAPVQTEMKEICKKMAIELNVRGLMNVQLALQDDRIYVIEVNPRASRTIPFVSKCIGVSLAKVAARCMVGQTLKDQNIVSEIIPEHYSVKEAVFPFNKFPGIDPILGPEMKSTGEVMGVGETFGEAYGKAELGANDEIPDKGKVFISVRDRDKNEVGVQEGRPHIVDMIKSDSIDMIINSTEGRQAIKDSGTIRSSAEQRGIYCTTTIAGGNAVCEALKFKGEMHVRSLQQLHGSIS
jgi:carbamoyl-phosphate synthase large subunit